MLVGGFQLANIYDAAYGTKFVRVRKEAENIMLYEKPMLVPPMQAPFIRFYDWDTIDTHRDVGPVSSYWPFSASAFSDR